MKTEVTISKTYPIQFAIECHPEDEGPEGQFATGQDAEICRKIREELEWNEWAWCCVEVRAVAGPYVGTAYLGGCNYESQEDFEQGGYYQGLKQEAYDALMERIQS